MDEQTGRASDSHAPADVRDTPPGAGGGPWAPADPLARRVVTCVIWVVGYGLLWQFAWRPFKSVEWVNFAIIAGIMLGTLPPARLRPFTAATALLAVAAIMYLVFQNAPVAVLLGVLGLLALSDGAFEFRGRG